MKRGIIIRTDGGTSIGMGHVSRCVALAEMLKNNFTITFAIQKTSDSVVKTIQTVTKEIITLPQTNNYTEDAVNFFQHVDAVDIVVLDGYNFKTDYQNKLKEKKCKLVCIDDLHAWHFVSDAIINHAEGISKSEYSAESYTRLYLGLEYVLLREPFLKYPLHNKETNGVKKVFVSMGAADTGNLSQKFTEALLQVNGIEEIHLMLGSINPNLKSIERLIQNNKRVNINTHFDISAKALKKLLEKCDVAVCPASTISLECCATGIGLISGYTQANQEGILKGLLKHNAAVNFGSMNELSVEGIKNNFQKLFAQPELFNEMKEHQRRMIDGKSPSRLLNIFKELSGNRLHFRFASEKDADLYFHWANDPLVRENSYNQNPVSYEDHLKWFHSKVTSQNCSLYLFFNEEDEPMGQSRIEKNDNETVISISIDKSFRGKSYGSEILKTTTRDYLEKNSKATIVAYIKFENKASYNVFLKAGFGNEEIIEKNGNKSYRLHKKISS